MKASPKDEGPFVVVAKQKHTKMDLDKKQQNVNIGKFLTACEWTTKKQFRLTKGEQKRKSNKNSFVLPDELQTPSDFVSPLASAISEMKSRTFLLAFQLRYHGSCSTLFVGGKSKFNLHFYVLHMHSLLHTASIPLSFPIMRLPHHLASLLLL